MMILKMMNVFFVTFMMLSYFLTYNFNSPLIMGFSVLMQATTISLMISISFSFSWFSFLIFIVYLGGILMIFSYVISMTNLKKEFMIFNDKSLFTIIVFLFILSIFLKEDSEFPMNFYNSFLENLLLLIYSKSIFKMSIILMIFLFFILIVTVFITEMSKGQMRSI
uniref:NADH dehydrogenase subunit 6 n=1 Tax=Dendrothrips minowai TaxID=1030662 RepID=A0A343WRP3_9NEOP|nr:NADH dehydrogenase subunit 6 [Dendrothrips minowai]AWD37112.1 NADH dehydrogenase subunit 6 [Dendrothrips minowai]